MLLARVLLRPFLCLHLCFIYTSRTFFVYNYHLSVVLSTQFVALLIPLCIYTSCTNLTKYYLSLDFYKRTSSLQKTLISLTDKNVIAVMLYSPCLKKTVYVGQPKPGQAEHPSL
jgi:hypothetical protein